jgi:hypothetical protein
MDKRIIYTNPIHQTEKRYFPQTLFNGVLSNIPTNQDRYPYSFETLIELENHFPFMKNSELVVIENNINYDYRY